MLYIIQQSVLLTYGPDARRVAAPFYYRIQLPWFGYSGYNLFVIAAAIVLLVVVWFILSRTRIGLVMRAAQFDAETAQPSAFQSTRSIRWCLPPVQCWRRSARFSSCRSGRRIT